MADLNVDLTVALANVGGTVTGTVILGPGLNGDRGPATWIVTGVITKTNRPGSAPIPRVEVFRENGISQGVSYDGSFTQGPCDITLIRSQFLRAVWTGGTVGDIATLTLSGTKK